MRSIIRAISGKKKKIKLQANLVKIKIPKAFICHDRASSIENNCTNLHE
jgi:hypothetical protein